MSGRRALMGAWAALSLAGCGGSSRAANSPTASNDSAETAPAQVAPADAEPEQESEPTVASKAEPSSVEADGLIDKSFAPSVYEASGMPSVGKRWSANDYLLAGQALSRLAQKNRAFLPRENSDKSGPVFARLMDRGNFEGLAELATAERVKAKLAYLDVLPQFLGLYAPADDGVEFPREQVRWVELLIGFYPSALSDLRESLEAGEASEQMLDHHRKVAVAVVQGAAVMLREPELYRPSDLAILEQTMAEHGPALQAELDEASAKAVGEALMSR